MSEHETKTLALQESILAETQKTREITTEVYMGNQRLEKGNTAFNSSVKDNFKKITKQALGIGAALFTFNKQFRAETIRRAQDAKVRIDIARENYNEGLRERELTRPRLASFEKFLVKTIKFTLVFELIKGLVKGIGRAIISPFKAIGKFLKLDKLLAVPLNAIRDGIGKVLGVLKDNFKKIILGAIGLLIFLKSNNPIIKSIRESVSKVLSGVTAKLFGVEDTGSFLSTFQILWTTKMLPVILESWTSVTDGIKLWWSSEGGGRDSLDASFKFINTQIEKFMKSDGALAIKNAFITILDSITHTFQKFGNIILYGTEGKPGLLSSFTENPLFKFLVGDFAGAFRNLTTDTYVDDAGNLVTVPIDNRDPNNLDNRQRANQARIESRRIRGEMEILDAAGPLIPAFKNAVTEGIKGGAAARDEIDRLQPEKSEFEKMIEPVNLQPAFGFGSAPIVVAPSGGNTTIIDANTTQNFTTNPKYFDINALSQFA